MQRATRIARGYPNNLTPTQRAAFNAADAQHAQQRAKAAAKAENDKRDREYSKIVQKADESLNRLVAGTEVQTFEDMVYLANLYMNKGDEDGPEQFLRKVDNFNDDVLYRETLQLKHAHRKSVKELEDKFYKFVRMTDKRDTKRLVESFRGTAYESIAQAIYDASPKRPVKEKVVEEKVEE